MLTDWDGPWDSLRRLHDEVSRALDDTVFDSRYMPAFVRRHSPFPKLNLYETPESYLLTCELPGVITENLDLSLTGRQLTIKGERPAPEGTNRRYDRHERGFGRFSRTLELPGPVEPDGLSASLKLGVLTVKLTRSPESKPKQIAVKAVDT